MMLGVRIAEAGLDWLVPEWPAPRNVAALVTTRSGGAGTGSAASLDLGPAAVDALDARRRAAVLDNRRRLSDFLPAPPVWLAQVHGPDVVVVDADNVARLRASPPIVDAAVTTLADTPVAVRVADCLPVFFTDDGGTVVGVAHAGWRGLAAGVLEAAIDGMAVAPSAIAAWLGPAIGPAAFEVGADVRDAFCDREPGAAAHFRAHVPGKWLADLPALARMRLARAGVARVSGGEHCTVSAPQRFFSYRRDRTPARFAAVIWRAGRDPNQ